MQKSTCGPHAAPPPNIVPGDVLVFHASSCTDEEAHATLVTTVKVWIKERQIIYASLF